jgi:hypothetical protein
MGHRLVRASVDDGRSWGMSEISSVQAVLLPHSHWDREWYEPFAIFRVKLAAMMDLVLELLDEPGQLAHFHLDGQTVMVEDYLDLRPERRTVVEDHIRSGRLSVGPFYTLTDEFLVSGEGIIRNLERGLGQAEALGLTLPVGGPWAAYFPDQFGHIGQLPQILRLFGIEHVVVLRGVPAAVDRSCFVWQGTDGSEVLTEYMVHGYSLGADISDPDATVDGDYPNLEGAVARARSVSDRDVVLVPVGADHTAPHRGQFPLALEQAANLGLSVEVGSLQRFLTLAGRPADPPVWRGELRAASTWVLLPNTVATRAHQKRRRGLLEARLERYAEPLAALLPGMWDCEALAEAWDLMHLNAGHDCAYGAGADSVAADVDSRFDRVDELVTRVIDRAADHLRTLPSTPGILRWNPSPFERDGVAPLGWDTIDRSRRIVPQPVEVTTDGTDLVVDSMIRVFFSVEEDDGDLFTFSPSPGSSPVTSSIECKDDDTTTVVFDGVRVELKATRRGDDPFVRLDLTVDNRRQDHRLRLHVHLPEAVESSTALSPFEVVQRTLRGEGFASEVGSPTWPARGAVLAGQTAVLAEGVMEYEVTDTSIAVTLLRAAGVIAKPTVPTRPIWAGPSIPAPDGQCQGTYRMSFGINPSATAENLVHDHECFVLPLLEIETHGGGAHDTGQLLDVTGARISAIRRRGDDLEVRVWNDSVTHRTASVWGMAVELGPAEIRTVTVEGWGSGSPALGHASPD